MRTFNPEKELNKIQKGNKNKIIIGVCLLLLIVAIGSSYALYQIKYNKQIIYTTVEPFYSKDIQLAVYVDGVRQDNFPPKDGEYSYSGYECENDSIVTFDPKKWIAEIKVTGQDKCSINFGNKNNFYDTLIESKNILTDETKDGNLRYIGPNPDNYIWFNCDDYNFTTADEATLKNCERWRIIGIMNNMTIVDEATGEETNNQSLVKVIRTESIGELSWDNKDTTTGAETDQGNSNWAEARLMKLLNPGYDGEEKGGSLYWNADSGECYAGEKNATIPCDFTSTGLKIEDTKQMIESVIWNLGAHSSANGPTPIRWYQLERGSLVYTGDGRLATWKGKIALHYPSDYGLASIGGDDGRTACLERNMYYWYEEPYKSECGGTNNWMFSEFAVPTLTVYNTPSYLIAYYSNSRIYEGNLAVKTPIRPVLYLKPTIKIISGSGTYEEPYIIK